MKEQHPLKQKVLALTKQAIDTGRMQQMTANVQTAIELAARQAAEKAGDESVFNRAYAQAIADYLTHLMVALNIETGLMWKALAATMDHLSEASHREVLRKIDALTLDEVMWG